MLSFFRMNRDWYCHRAEGTLQFDPGVGTKWFKPWWLLLKCDEEIVRYYKWLLLKWGFPVQHNALWGAHISVVKGEKPIDEAMSCWGPLFEGLEIEFYHTHFVRGENNCHWWIDVYSEELSRFRQLLGLEAKERYHLTIGRIDCFCNDHKLRK